MCCKSLCRKCCRKVLCSYRECCSLKVGVHIRFCGNGGCRFRFYSESLGKAPSNQGLLPRHSVPRFGSACPHSGIAPGGRRHRPSMAGGGYRGILAAVPPAQRLRSASGKGAVDQNQKPQPQQDQKIAASFHSTAPTGERGCTHAPYHSTGRALARLQLLISMHRPLERPSGGSAQWATRHGCRVSRPRPWMADGGGPTEQDRSEGMPSLGEAPNERGKSALVTFRRAAQAFRK